MASRHAVVIGASLAGVLAARSLTETFDRVTLVDRDQMPHRPVTRGGVPQGRHTHGLLARGREVIEELFPGTTTDLQARGALVGDAQADTLWHFGPEALAPGHTGLRMLAVSRPLLEWYLRSRLIADPRVEVLERTSVLDLATTADGGQVNGVIACTGDGRVPRLLPADLVVDASGRTSRTPEWLERRGYASPPEEVRRVDKHYATRHFRRDPAADGALAVVIAASPTRPRGGVMVAQEDGSWIVSLTGRQDDRPPTDLAGFRAFAATLASPAIAERIAGLDPLDEGLVYRFPANRRRHYEQLASLPNGLVVTGDALCAFDPVFGQGVTVAALEARELREAVAEGGDDLARRFHARAARLIDTPWAIAAGAASPLVGAYLRNLLVAGSTDPTLAAAFLRVNQLYGRPADLMRPGLALRVARHAMTVGRSRVSAGSRPAPAARRTAPRAAGHG